MAVEASISKEEIALYDRQIRLWGMEAQTRLRSSSILFQGIKALTLEACKNLVLAGVGCIALCDSAPVTEDDLESQYYFTAEDVGKPKDSVLAERLRILNPLVQISVRGSDVDLEKYELVVVVGKDFGCAMKVNDRCRQSGEGVRFVAADAFGVFGYLFADCLSEHEFLEETKVANPESGDRETKRETKVARYKSLRESLDHQFSISNPRRLSRVLSPLVVVYQGKEDRTVTEEKLRAAVDSLSKAKGIPDGWVSSDLIVRVVASWGTEFVPCAAVMGGTLAQEILKIVTRKDMPMNNWFVYDAISGDGLVSTV
ncbi:hypothetical protein GQ54DRAFT_313174 [Martensiomyces pterosporus]|nr:hypothetical protein GQ54DRAFT_313174 [Martensiomyces pterosporus]